MAWEAVDWIVVTQEQQLKQAFMITVMNNTWGSMNTAKFQPAAVEQNKKTFKRSQLSVCPTIQIHCSLDPSDELIFRSSFPYSFPLSLSPLFCFSLSCHALFFPRFPSLLTFELCFFIRFSFNLIPLTFVYNFSARQAWHNTHNLSSLGLNHLTEILTPLKKTFCFSLIKALSSSRMSPWC